MSAPRKKVYMIQRTERSDLHPLLSFNSCINIMPTNNYDTYQVSIMQHRTQPATIILCWPFLINNSLSVFASLVRRTWT